MHFCRGRARRIRFSRKAPLAYMQGGFAQILANYERNRRPSQAQRSAYGAQDLGVAQKATRGQNQCCHHVWPSRTSCARQYPLFSSVSDALETLSQEFWRRRVETVFAIGGMFVLGECIPRAQLIYRTVIRGHFEADVFLADEWTRSWTRVAHTETPECTFETWARK